MQFSAYALALFSALASTSLADTIYAAFLDSNGAQIGNVARTIGKENDCFSEPGAAQIVFTKFGFGSGDNIAGGPYCARAYYKPACTGDFKTQRWTRVYIKERWPYRLNDDIRDAASYKIVNCK
ncbi:hypothetical protein BDU57DRAFT_282585 [Ampelomyces quisqualis]|uniref:Uncharacterized protein n=1 Tax=Ampelomyces quisqualis TaxID=50730 RepID=A0A6A5QH38_AMPQU|nr:hypothetical protein BDU57DRAFT_282585 [Ampelomyces quisqualis]